MGPTHLETVGARLPGALLADSSAVDVSTMIGKPLVAVGLTLAALVPLAWTLGSRHLQPSQLSARGVDPLLDTDGDSVPDNVEWLFMSDPTKADSDGDGRDDFLEIAQHTSLKSATPVQPMDDEMRVAVSIAPDPDSGVRYVWMHCLFRFASGTPNLSWCVPYLSTAMCPVPIIGMIGQTPLNLTMRTNAREGMYAIASMRLATVAEFRHVVPCTVNVRAAVGGRYVCSSAYVFDSDGALCTLLPQGLDCPSAKMVVQTIEPHDGSKTTTFASNRKCEQTLVFAGMSAGGAVYEVDSSSCEVSEGMRCGASCPKAVGTSIVLSSGMGSLTGR